MQEEGKENNFSGEEIFNASEYDPYDTSWWDKRDMGRKDDPYNNIPSFSPDSADYKKYIKLAKNQYKILLQEAESGEGWSFLREEQNVLIHSKSYQNSAITCFRGKGVINTTPEILRLHLAQIDLRKFWDDDFLSGSYTKIVTEALRLSHFKFKTPWPVSPRDFVFLGGETLVTREEIDAESKKTRKVGIVLMCAKSVNLEDQKETPGFVRGELSSSGYIIKPLPSTKETPRCELTYLVQMSAGGWVPNWLSNWVNTKQPLCIAKIRATVDAQADIVDKLMDSLMGLKESRWKVKNIKSRCEKIVAPNKNLPPPMLWEPLNYWILGTRIPDKSDEDKVFKVMEKKRKKRSFIVAWEGNITLYCCISRKSKIFT